MFCSSLERADPPGCLSFPRLSPRWQRVRWNRLRKKGFAAGTKTRPWQASVMDEILPTLTAALDAAGPILLHHHGRTGFSSKQSDIDLVTVADKESEAAIKQVISRQFPDHTILAE